MVDGGGGNVQVVIVSPKRLVHVLNVLFGPVSAVRNKAGAPKNAWDASFGALSATE
jgi:hypothetical protein